MRKISELICQSRKRADRAEGTELLPEQEYINKADGFKVNVLAMGDVGGTLVMGLRLLGGETIADIGIYDLKNGIGLRIEDDCLITEHGCENLSACIPREIDDLRVTIQTIRPRHLC